MYSAPRGTYILASVLHRSLPRHVCRRIDFCVILSPSFSVLLQVRASQAAGFKIYRADPRGINLQDERRLKNSLLFPKYRSSESNLKKRAVKRRAGSEDKEA